ncbi:Transposase [Mycoplasmopsis fermentans M64]|uniref:Transposase n=1 Tax=Mycoplasmopsis fermentans (strain M64) TaxID=943945 RepID=A0AB32XD84_MYCFM|nr:Transposase [Mycoplasmopsis fermentans M64]
MQKKLSWNERNVLEYLLWTTNYSITKIAKILGYSRTTINNEIKNLYPNIDVPSFKTVYNWIKSGHWILNWKDLLRKFYKKGGKREKQSAARRLVGARYVRPFWSRPANINERKEFGHWEIDLIVGKSKGTHCHFLSFTERVSRYGFLVKIHEI